LAKYLGVKVVEAEPGPNPKDNYGHPAGEMGYTVKYPDGYVS
jgi:hypothetical protein